MAGIIYQPTIDKKRKKCCIPIESIDMKKLEALSRSLQFIA
ncbi:hypothetical protein ACW9HX_00810 [Pseudomonas sp. SDO52101_S400]